ncbi:glycosyltransferase [Winogradskyella vidalii]|uniref:glycosyltransferase n=1 Tax=Winogradskyella vidalii TaxID=2615024 RepID=UPI0015C94281|nr:glycosyltransferase [Winogradskyella vidalii]
MKKKVLICIDWFLPAYKAGGPIQSIANLVNHTKNDFDYHIATSNADLYESLDLPETSLNIWMTKADYKIIYLNPEHQNRSFYKKIFLAENFEVVYFNSLFSKNFTLLPLLVFRNMPIRKVLAPRGMLGQGALAIKPLKKKLFLKVFNMFNFHKKVIWHATAESEALEVHKHFGKQVKVLLAPNLSAKTKEKTFSKPKAINSVNLFFLSRIAVKKNLLTALSYLAEVDKKYHVNFTIIGPIDEPDYWANCQSKIAQLPKHIKVSYVGAIPHFKLDEILNTKHVLLLPTQHENFGHVIMEAWQSACPVIISDQTPWRSLLNQYLGFDIPLSKKDEFIKAIEKFAAMDTNEFQSWSEATVKFAKAFTENPKLIEQNKALFLNTINN